MIDKFYELSCNFDRFGDPDDEYRDSEDGYLEVFEGHKNLKDAFFDCAPITLGGNKGIVEYESAKDGDYLVINAQMPKEIKFIVDPNYLSMTDFPNLEYADFWPVMSRKMAEVILSVGDFPHQIIPVTFEDCWDMPIECDYVILHINELSDFLDQDKSVYSREPVMDDSGRTFICDIKKLVLKEPENGFPPMFRVKWTSVDLFISAEAKAALEAAGIQGLGFARLQQLYLGQDYD